MLWKLPNIFNQRRWTRFDVFICFVHLESSYSLIDLRWMCPIYQRYVSRYECFGSITSISQSSSLSEQFKCVSTLAQGIAPVRVSKRAFSRYATKVGLRDLPLQIFPFLLLSLLRSLSVFQPTEKQQQPSQFDHEETTLSLSLASALVSHDHHDHRHSNLQRPRSH